MPNDLAPPTHWSTTQTRAQFAAIANLRWRIFLNSFRRKGGVGELIGRIILGLIFTAFALSMMATAGGLAFLAAYEKHLARLDLILWGIFLLCQLLNIQLGNPGTTFDPTQLIRFPMPPRIYIAIRLFFGLLSPANIMAALLSLSVAIGLTVAMPEIWPYAFTALALFALTNALFSRMVFAWVDRWLSTRRAREVFTGLIFVVSMCIQWANVSFNPAYGHHNHSGQFPMQRYNAALNLFHHSQAFIAPLPPGLISTALLQGSQGHTLAFLELTLGCAAFALLFLAIFAWRMTIEFRGENLSDAANAVSTKSTRNTSAPSPPTTTAPTAATAAFNLFPPAISAVLAKELLQVRRNTGLFYGLIGPIVFVFLFAGRLASNVHNASWIFPASLAYTMMGVSAMAYNSFGLEGAGSQFYFLAPVPLWQVFLAKNLISFILAAIEVSVTYAIISVVAGRPSFTMTAFGILWAASTILFNTCLGNLRSVTSPKKIDLGRAVSKQASQLSSLIAFGVLLASIGLGVGFFFLAQVLHAPWTLAVFYLLLTIIALVVYRQSLRSLDTFTLTHREQLFAELCKQ